MIFKSRESGGSIQAPPPPVPPKTKVRNKTIANREILEKALKTYGFTPQIIMVFEEMAELQKELSKHLRGRDNKLEIIEEIADVEIMLEQMKILFDIEKAVDIEKGIKIVRLDGRITDDTRKCRVCGCTNLHGCPEGCWWVEYDLCSACVDKE